MLTMKKSVVLLAVVSAACVASALAVACGDDAVTETPVNRDAGGVVDGGNNMNPNMVDGSMGGNTFDGSPLPDGAIPMDCVANPDPNKYTDILNACTDSYYLDPHPNLPLLYSDGGLPPLP